MHELTPGLAAIVSDLELRVVDCDASFALGRRGSVVDGAEPDRVAVTPPGATIGRGEQADLQLAGSAAAGMSRHHLVVRASERGWTVRDCSSSGTWEWVAPQGERGGADWGRLPADVAIPVGDGLTLCLGPELRLRLATYRRPLPGGVTPGSRPPARGRAARVQPAALERLAAALLAPRRTGRADPRPPKPTELQASLAIEHSTLYEQAERLRKLPEVSPHVPRGVRRVGLAETADALALAFPYLLGGD